MLSGTSIYCMYNIYKVLGHKSYEMLPLASCTIQSLSHFLMFFFYTDNRLQIVTAYFCLFTYVFVAQSFLYLYYKLKYPVSKFKSVSRWIIGLTVLAVIALTLLTLICVIVINPHDCDKFFHIGLSIQLTAMLISSTVCWMSGTNLMKIVVANTMEQIDTPMLEEGISMNVQSHMYKTLTNQITFVVNTLIISSILFVILLLLQLFAFDNILCLPADEKLTIGENVFLLFFAFVEMTPCFSIPYVFFYLPQMQRQQQSAEDAITFDNVQDSVPFKMEKEFTEIVHRMSETS